ncbi:MAG TPA: polysaccharide deacetylase family protein [Actinomycetota bacterium]|nr:polysaccharide deacetylase family protein [Actinomycetota bacterium]
MRPIARPLVPIFVAATLVLPGRALATTVPVQVTAPAANALLRGSTQLKATAPDADSVTFQIGRDGGGPYRALATDSTRADGWHAPWDTASVADGRWFLRVKASGGGLFFSDPVPVTVDNTAPALSLAVSPGAFSPNGDRIKDRTFVTLQQSEPAAVELDVVNAAGKVVIRLDPGHRLAAGQQRFDWGGLVNKGGHWVRAQDGVFAVKATATDDAGNTGTAAVAAIRLDTQAPGFAWGSVRPEPASGSGPIALSFQSFDPGSTVGVSAAIWNALQRVSFVDGVTKPTGPGTVQISPPASPPPGLYRARIVLTDEAGNRSESPFLPFRIQHPVTTTVVRGFTGVGNRIALTFDDCVFGDAWTSILNTLEARGLRATFFCASVNLDRNPAQARRTVADGMSIGSHTRDHPDLTTLSYDQIRTQLADDIDAWWRIAHATPLPLFRPPYGAYDSDVLRAAGDLGFVHTVTWDVDPQDWSDPGVGEIQTRVLSHAHAGMIVVMHVKPETAAALPGLLDALAARGYHQTALDELFRLAPGGPSLRTGPPSWGRHGSG